MQKMTSLTILALLTSCSAPQPKMETMREPSSLMGGKYLDSTFKKSAAANTTEEDINDDLKLVKELDTRGNYYLNEFDNELDGSVEKGERFSLEKSESYKRLMVIRSLRESVHDKITFYYLSLVQSLNNKSIDEPKKNYFSTVLKNIKAKLNSKNDVEQVVYGDIKNKINSSVDEMQVYDKSLNGKEHKFSVKFKEFASKVFNYEKFRKKELAAGLKKNELDNEIEVLSSNVSFGSVESREPQSLAKYEPSTTRSGNIVGGSFPKNTWALTYDDGPHKEYTPKILANLEELGHKATFFWLAQNVIQYKSVVDLAREKGMALNNHSWSHANLPKMSDARLEKEIVQSTKVETAAYGEKIRFFRCPYGAGTNITKIRQMIADQGMIHVFWNVDTLDWQDKNADSVYARAKKFMKQEGRGVVLFHDIHPQSVVASKKLMMWADGLKGTEEEIRWVTLPEIVDEQNSAAKAAENSVQSK